MSEFTPLREVVDTLVSRSPSPDFGELKRRSNRRGRRRVVMAAATTAAVIAGSVLATTNLGDDQRTAPVEQPKLVVGAVPVWYDANGLHRGDVVEQTPVELVEPEQVVGPDEVVSQGGALALVRSGALYMDPKTGDVWFHPWGGEPRIVGRNSEAGPGGDPNGDTAVWFEGSDAYNGGPGELVIYDTATGREISRTTQADGVTQSSGDHYPAGNRFLQVSAERVAWSAGTKTYSYDVRTQMTSMLNDPKGRGPADVHDGIEVLGEDRGIVLRVPGRAEQNYPHLETHLRLSPSGNFLLAVEGTNERHAAAIVDTRTGELWRVPKDAYPWIAWSYDDIAMVDTADQLLACDAARRTCEPLPAERGFLLPTN
jgi:hypothetical protein